MQEELKDYCIHLGDNALILGHRLSEWCGHGPILEQDIAMTNISLDLIGQARLYFQYAATLESKGRSEDDIAYMRLEREYKNCLLVEQTNGHWGKTIMRQYLFDVYNYKLLEWLSTASDEGLRNIAIKSIKEVAYHKAFSSDWLARLANGTQLSHSKMQDALDDCYHFAGELVEPFDLETKLIEKGILNKKADWEKSYFKEINTVLESHGLTVAENAPMIKGGRDGMHTEHMGFILAELQYMQRTYPNMEW